MDATIGSAANNTNNFEPSSDIIDEEECNTILVYLPGFRKDELKVQLKGSKVVKISGTRTIGDNKWSSFQKDFPLSENCDTNKISAKFEDGILYIRLPKLIVPAEKDGNKLTPPPPPVPTPNVVDDSEHTGHHVDEATSGKSVEEKEEKPMIRNDKEKVGHEPAEKKKVEERNDVVRDDNDKVGGKEYEGGDDHYNMVMNAAGKLKMAREKMSKILLFLFAFALGFYLGNLSWFSTKVEN